MSCLWKRRKQWFRRPRPWVYSCCILAMRVFVVITIDCCVTIVLDKLWWWLTQCFLLLSTVWRLQCRAEEEAQLTSWHKVASLACRSLYVFSLSILQYTFRAMTFRLGVEHVRPLFEAKKTRHSRFSPSSAINIGIIITVTVARWLAGPIWPLWRFFWKCRTPK